MNQFDPVALHNFDASIGSESVIVDSEMDDTSRVRAAEFRRKCSNLKLSSRIIGLAAAQSAELTDENILIAMSNLMGRIATLRQVSLKVLGVEKGSPDFPAIFNSLTSSMLDAVVEEWKWTKLSPKSRQMNVGMLSTMLDAVIKFQTETHSENGRPVNHELTRRLCIIESVPKIYALINYFDYYQASHDLLMSNLLSAVSDQAEYIIRIMSHGTRTDYEVQALIQRSYSVSLGLMCEVYKSQSFRDVAQLRELPGIDLSIAVAEHHNNGGMSYAHVIEAHRAATDRMLSTSNLIFESQQRGN